MLKGMRKNVKSLSIFLWVVIFSFVFFIFVDWGAGRLGPNANADTVAWVGGDRILTADFNTALRDRKEMINRRYGEQAKQIVNDPQFPARVLQEMVQERIMTLEADRLGIKASDDEVKGKIQTYPVFKDEKGRFVGYQRYQETLSYFHMTIPQFEESLRKEIIIDKLKTYLTAGITVTPDQAFSEYKKEKDGATVDAYILDSQQVPYDGVPTDAELKAFYAKRQGEFRIPEMRGVSYVLFDTKSAEKKVGVSDGEVKSYYQDNIVQFKEPEKKYLKRIFVKKSDKSKEKIEAVLKALKEGKDFSLLAKENSEDAKAQSGGDWGAFEWLYLIPEQEKEAIKKLNEGAISPAVESEQGTSILYLYKFEAEKVASIEEVKDRISTFLRYQKAQKQVQKEAQEFLKNVGKKDLATGASKLGMKVGTAQNLRNGDAIPEVDPSGAVSKEIFNLTKNGEKSQPIFTYNGAVVAQLLSTTPERAARYEEVGDKVREAFIGAKRRELAYGKAKEMVLKLQGGSVPPAAPFMTVKSGEAVTRVGTLADVGRVKGLETFAFTKEVGSVSEPLYTDKGYVVLKLQKKEIKSQEDFNKEKKAFMESLIANQKDLFFAGIFQNLLEKYPVKVNNFVMESYRKGGE